MGLTRPLAGEARKGRHHNSFQDVGYCLQKDDNAEEGGGVLECRSGFVQDDSIGLFERGEGGTQMTCEEIGDLEGFQS